MRRLLAAKRVGIEYIDAIIIDESEVAQQLALQNQYNYRKRTPVIELVRIYLCLIEEGIDKEEACPMLGFNSTKRKRQIQAIGERFARIGKYQQKEYAEKLDFTKADDLFCAVLGAAEQHIPVSYYKLARALHMLTKCSNRS